MIIQETQAGIPVIILPTRRKLAKIAIFINVGSAFETTTKGMAHFFEHMMFKGTTNRSALDVIQQIELMGAATNAYTGKYMTCYFATGLNSLIDRDWETSYAQKNAPFL